MRTSSPVANRTSSRPDCGYDPALAAPEVTIVSFKMVFLPPVNERYTRTADFEGVVSKAIVEGQVEQLIAWLEARIQSQKSYVPNYLALAQVLEEERQDVEDVPLLHEIRIAPDRRLEEQRHRQRQAHEAEGGFRPRAWSGARPAHGTAAWRSLRPAARR